MRILLDAILFYIVNIPAAFKNKSSNLTGAVPCATHISSEYITVRLAKSSLAEAPSIYNSALESLDSYF